MTGKHVAWAEVGIIFLALVRTLTAFYLLKAGPGDVLPVGQVAPLITGSLVAVLCCLVLAVLCRYRRYRLAHVAFVLAILSLVLVKILH
jgi:hypothetical protein